MSLPLKRAEQQSGETAEAEAKARWQRMRRRAGLSSAPPRPRRPPAFAARIDEALSASVQASLAREQAHAHRAEAKALIGAFSEVDHP